MTSLLDAPVTFAAIPDQRITLNVLGPLQVGLAGHIQPVGSLRQRRILSMLAVGAISARPLTSDELVLGAYGDEAQRGARRSLSTELWRCRRMLGRSDAILSGADGYRLDTSIADVDALRFIEQLRLGRTHSDAQEPDLARDVLQAALPLWRGSPVTDWRDHAEGLAVARRLEELRIGGAEDLARAHLLCSEATAAVDVLLPLVQAHPQREHAWALLIDAYVALGDRRRAGSAFDSARRMLSDYGLELGVELSAAQARLGLRQVVLATQRRPERTPGVDPSFAGREAELEELHQLALRSLEGERPSLAFVSGEQGIGKTALVDRFVSDLRRVRGDVAVERVLCAPRGDADHPKATTAGAARVLVVEDVQWASVACVQDLLLQLGPQTQAPVLVVVTHSEGCAAPSEALAELRRRADLRLQLAGLPADAIATLPAHDPETARRAHRATGGNPLYLRHWQDGRPSPALADVLDARLAAADPGCLPALELASAIGCRFSTTLLTAAAARLAVPLSPLDVRAALQQGEQSGLLEVAGAGAERRFVHGVLRDRLMERTPPTRAAQLHAAIAFALDRLVGTLDVQASVHSHHAESGWPEYPTLMAVRHLVAAAHEAARELAFDRAGSCFARALDLVGMDPDGADQELVGTLLAGRAEAALAEGALDDAGSTYQALVVLGERGGLPFTRLRGYVGAVGALGREWLDPDAMDGLAGATRSAASAGATNDADRDLLAEAVTVLALRRPLAASALREQALARDPDLEVELLRRGWELEGAASRRQLAHRMLQGGGDLAWATRHHAALLGLGEASLAEAQQLLTHEGSPRSRWEAIGWQLCAAIAAGRFARAERLLAQAEPLSLAGSSPREIFDRTTSLRRQRELLAGLLAGRHAITGVVPLPVGGPVDDYARYVGVVSATPSLVAALAGSALAAGHAEGIALCRAGLQPHQGQHIVSELAHYGGAVDFQLGRLSAATGDLDAAVEHYERARAQHRSVEASWFEAVGVLELATVLARRDAAGDRSAAQRLRAEASRIMPGICDDPTAVAVLPTRVTTG